MFLNQPQTKLIEKMTMKRSASDMSVEDAATVKIKCFLKEKDSYSLSDKKLVYASRSNPAPDITLFFSYNLGGCVDLPPFPGRGTQNTP